MAKGASSSPKGGESAAAPSGLSLAGQLDHYGWRGGYTLVSAALAGLMLVGFPMAMKEVWPQYLALIGADEHPDSNFAFAINAAVWSLAVFWIGNGIMYLVYKYEPAFMEPYRVSDSWPWKSSAKRQAEWYLLLLKTLAQLFVNQVLIALPTAYFMGDFARALGFSFAGGDAFPTLPTILLQVGIALLVEDTLFYWGHRTLHHPSIYKYVHKQHHMFQDCTISLSSEFAHPFEFFVANLVPFTTGLLLCGGHAVSWQVWTLWRIGETLDAHCGYDLPWSPYRILPFSGSAGHHDYHHSHNKGCFGSFFIFWDALCGTDQAYLAHVAKYGHVDDARFRAAQDAKAAKRKARDSKSQ